MDMVVSNICRDKKDLTKFYRHIYNDLNQEKTNPPEILSLRNIFMEHQTLQLNY